MKNKLLIATLLFSFAASSCNDWLDVRPGTRQTAGQLFETYQGYKDALTGCYIKMQQRTLYGENLTMTTLEYLAQHWDFGPYVPSAARAKAIKGWEYENDEVRNVMQEIYGGWYNVIIQANDILLAMPETGASIEDAAARAIIEGEALGIRAFCHFDVLRLFGQVPGGARQVSLPYSERVSREAVAYYNYHDFTAKIEADLLRAEELLSTADPLIPYSVDAVNYQNQAYNFNGIPDDFLRYRQLRFNYYAVKALQARFYLYTGRTDEAYAAARAVINATNASDGSAKFTLQRVTSTTTDFVLPGECIFMFNVPQLDEYITRLFNRASGNISLYMAADKLSHAEMFGGAVSTSTDTRYRFVWDNAVRDQSWNARPVLMKYDQTDVPAGDVDRMVKKQIIPAIRLSEMYLIAMETSNDMAEINSLYETYCVARELRAENFTDKSRVLEMIVKEYRRDFFAEGQMFYTYKRLGAERMLWTVPATTAVTENAYIVPLPTTEFDPNL